MSDDAYLMEDSMLTSMAKKLVAVLYILKTLK